ncbi:ribokinase [Xylanimonas ulmi]|uniref:Ribokinase n=1 Tax=Xylanimonas ulmi TaxID=228973 RepID=A0A4Q7M315_9MICO|nr:ribokinase [Xylanibacterium ulmi]RZS62295.1 ribokinase [Xylanibacterium ulmi]
MSVVVVGSVNADLVTRVTAHPAPGQTVAGQSMAVLAGGKGANQAVAAARLGARVAFVGAVGDDEFADVATSTLRTSGIDLSGLRVVAGPTGLALITVSADGENTIVVVPGANAAVDDAAVAANAAAIASADVVLLQGEIPTSGVEAAARAAAARVVLNLAPVVDLDPDVLRLADPLVVNEHEARGALALLGAPPDAGDLQDVAAALVRAGVRSVVVTLGAVGALVATPCATAQAGPPDVVAIPAPRVSALDTTGAGDAFVGALVQRLAAGVGLVDAARFAARVGAYAVTGAGAQASYPDAATPLPAVGDETAR